MRLYVLTLIMILQTRMQNIFAEQDFHKESVPACGRAFLYTNQFPKYYETKLKSRYEASKGKSDKEVGKILVFAMYTDSKQLGPTKYYFRGCVSRKLDQKDEANLEIYAKCRHKLTLEMEEVTSKTLANSLSNTTAGLQKALADLKKRYKNITRVKRFEACLKQYIGQ
ncbi:unnamed protein product [Acanthoscelides obtectus]|uniref:Uncharacterized protein n=1 Tax=Acanthoscelides obtectus TaxID=200917 RepID=A0A9P0LR42_ACAOB|nr:unnamed protein product [Acanthoscelides obtectus]CAK1651311.1 hypothetical protein AOBTE_LOCUS17173 [Acanthoscelides obtectus]